MCVGTCSGVTSAGMVISSALLGTSSAYSSLTNDSIREVLPTPRSPTRSILTFRRCGACRWTIILSHFSLHSTQKKNTQYSIVASSNRLVVKTTTNGKAKANQVKLYPTTISSHSPRQSAKKKRQNTSTYSGFTPLCKTNLKTIIQRCFFSPIFLYSTSWSKVPHST